MKEVGCSIFNYYTEWYDYGRRVMKRKRWYTINAIARMFDVYDSTVREWIAKGYLKAEKKASPWCKKQNMFCEEEEIKKFCDSVIEGKVRIAKDYMARNVKFLFPVTMEEENV